MPFGAHVFCHSRKDGEFGYVYLIINNRDEVTTVELPKEAEVYALQKSDFSGLQVTKVTAHTIQNERNIPFIYWEDNKKSSEIATNLLTTNYFRNV